MLISVQLAAQSSLRWTEIISVARKEDFRDNRTRSAIMPVQLLLLLVFSAPPIAGQNNTPTLPEVIQLFQLDAMNKLRQTIEDQERVISAQEEKMAMLEDENASMDETIDVLKAEYTQLREEFSARTAEANESCEAGKTHLREEFDLEILTRMEKCEEECEEEKTDVESDHSQELERMRSKLEQCESTVQYMGELMVQSNQGLFETQNLTENIKEAEEETNRQWNGSLVDLDIKKLYIDVMNDMKIKFQSGDLSWDQKRTATGVIVETQRLLGQRSFEVLGLQIGDRNSIQIFEVLKGWKEAGNMTAQQDKAMQDLAEDTQIRMIQGILGVFGFTPEQGVQNYNVSAKDLRLLLQRPTFGPERL